MSSLQKYTKIIALDCLAGLCFVGVILFGWLPGPGGIPLFLAGLGLLAVNHAWARRWLETARTKSGTLRTLLFPNKPWIKHMYDGISVVLFLLAIYGFFATTSHLVATLCVGFICIAAALFLVNRDRLDKLSARFLSKKP